MTCRVSLFGIWGGHHGSECSFPSSALGSFLPFFFKRSVPFYFSAPFMTPMMHILFPLIVSHKSRRLHSFSFFFLFVPLTKGGTLKSPVFGFTNSSIWPSLLLKVSTELFTLVIVFFFMVTLSLLYFLFCSYFFFFVFLRRLCVLITHWASLS